MKQARLFLTLDSAGAFVVGTIILLFSSLISNLAGWEESFTRMEGFANLVYGSYSGTLLLLFGRGQLRRIFIVVLIIANSFWGLQCFVQVWRLQEEATYLGTVALLLEGIYLLALAYFEAKFVLPIVSNLSRVS
ncbi:hypothetical protein [Leptospira sp. id769339]|uniref:hypothetical protein n=1 Tax=Leptospira sp. id769339 TaxID=2864221 RepID=UPI00214C6BF6|nr:hypothetical protein [Leptospira sp. id769339]MCR1792810.1 hypothetical protein [Leptospira sp. id769339]